MSIETIILRADIYKAVQACRSVRDIRSYMNGAHIDFARHAIESTNGHRAISYQFSDMSGIQGKYIFNSTQTVPAKCVTVCIGIDTSQDEDNITISFSDKEAKEISSHKPETMNDTRFPEMDRVLDVGTTAQLPLRKVAFNPTYLADVGKILGNSKFPIVYCSFHGSQKMPRISVDFGIDNLRFILMPVKDKE